MCELCNSCHELCNDYGFGVAYLYIINESVLLIKPNTNLNEMKIETVKGNTTKWVFQLNLMIAVKRICCYWCGQGLRECGMCKGSGLFGG